MKILFFLALRHLVSRKRQTLVATCGMGIAVATLIAMTALMTGLEGKFLRETLRISAHVTVTDEEELTVSPAGARLAVLKERDPADGVGTRRPRPPDRPRRIKKPAAILSWARGLPGVVAATSSLVGEGFVSFGGKQQPIEVRGVDPREQEKVTPVSEYVIAGSYDDLGVRTDSVMLGSGVAEKIGASVGDRVVVAAAGRQGVSLEVVAIAETGIPPVDKSRAYVPLRQAQVLLGRPDTVNVIGVKLVDPDQAPGLVPTFTEVTGYRAESWQAQNANWLGIFAIQQLITRIILSAIVVVAAFGILNILIMIVLEKKRDIAILRSVGLTRGDIHWVFLVEGGLMGLMGALIGCLLGEFIMWQLSRVHIPLEGVVKTERFLLAKDPWLYVYGASFALISALLASVLPARRAAGTEPVDVIRGQA